ncbi:MAG: GIY-YIG nuclease family protein [Xanthobacteraceae bacterium]
MTERFFAYILTNRPKGVLYVGLTNNLARRIWEHRTKVTPGFTSKYGVTRLVYFEEYASILEARAREQTFKHWRRGWKLKLIEDVNPTWHDLYDELILLRITLPRMRCSAQRCTASGVFASSGRICSELATIPGLQRTTSCCAEPGKQI